MTTLSLTDEQRDILYSLVGYTKSQPDCPLNQVFKDLRTAGASHTHTFTVDPCNLSHLSLIMEPK